MGFGLGLALIIPLVWLLVWAIQRKPKSKSIAGWKPQLGAVNLQSCISANGNCHVENAGFYASMGKYICEIVCPKLELRRNIIADTPKELELKIQKEFDYCEQRIRDKKNQYYIRKLRKD